MLTNIWTSLLAGSVGGFAVAVLNWIREAITNKSQRKVAFLQDQVKLLYCPLQLWTTMTVKALERHAQIHKILETKDESEDFPTRTEIDNLIRLANSYSAKANEHNQKILETLFANWHLVDPEDIEVFSNFLLHQLRAQLEPFEIWKDFNIPIRRALVGDFQAIPMTFVDHVTKQWEKKCERLKQFM
jgi:hypothetical protein